MATIIDQIIELLADIDVDNTMAAMVYPHFKVRVGVIKRRSPAHPSFEFCLDMGREDIRRALYFRPFRSKKLLFVFPERWMSVLELNGFMDALHKHPSSIAGEIEMVDIITSSAPLMTNFPEKSMKMILFSDDVEYKVPVT
ncbi:MAG TPA: hypothetical protein VMW36_08755 [Patescibacteria group bacterium]|nr:hypothetical protein [Patescibacteria group bacterium]